MPENIRELYSETQAAIALVANFNDLLGDDDEARLDAIEGETQLVEIIASLVERLAVIDALVVGMNDAARKIAARKSRLANQAEMIRTAVGSAMTQSGLRKMETPLGTVSVKATPASLVVLNEADIPTRYYKPGPLDKRAIIAELKDGAEISGVGLSNGGETISIRSA